MRRLGYEQPPWIAARATLASNSLEWILLFRLIASLQSLGLTMKEALIVTQSLSYQISGFSSKIVNSEFTVRNC
jgi:chorismate-pyruvate lyase